MAIEKKLLGEKLAGIWQKLSLRNREESTNELVDLARSLDDVDLDKFATMKSRLDNNNQTILSSGAPFKSNSGGRM